MGVLDTAVRQGKALYAGISNSPPELTREAAAILRGMGTPLLIHQPRYSMLSRSPEDGLWEALDEVGAGAIVFSPLAQGLLSARYLNGVPEGSRAAGASPFLSRDGITEERVATLRALNRLAAERGQSLARMALARVLRTGTVTSALVGASSPEQLADSVAATENLYFTGEELAGIDTLLASNGA